MAARNAIDVPPCKVCSVEEEGDKSRKIGEKMKR